ncbi:hypothetical protein Syun_025327 [Stephania yunnanensis]|uniref:Uncharacterized protein n=1 Tax=Stephania yunnanensis TaxID=152371 RepID=A0AAP0EWV0_9MAGN
MRSSIVSVSLFGEADVWLCITVASMWTFWSAVGVMVSENVGVHASEYQSHSRHHHSQCEGLEMIRGKRGLDGRDKEITYCVSTMCGVYGASVKWTNAEYASVIRQLARPVDNEMKIVHLYSNICCEDVALAYIDGMRQMVCSLLGGRGGAQLITEEPSLSRMSPTL